MDSIPSISTQYIRTPKRRARREGTDITLSVYQVRMALMSGSNQPGDDDWGDALWETDDGKEYAKILVGPEGTLNPGKGVWTVWVDISAVPERVRQATGKVRIT